MKKKLTEKFIKSLKASNKEYTIYDTEIKGFQLRVSAIGAKAFSIRYTDKGGKRMRYKIGDYPIISVDLARQKALNAKQKVANGQCPASKQGNHNMTVSNLCDDYMTNGVSHKKASTNKLDAGRIKRHIKPLIGNIKLSSLTTKDILTMKRDIENGKNARMIKTKKRGVARVTGGKDAARSCTALVSAMLSFAVQNQMIGQNVAQHVKLPSTNMRAKFLSDAELGKLGAELLRKDKYADHAINIIMLLLMTGCRRGEIASLKWDDVDYNRQCLNLRDSKTGPRAVPIGDPALEFIKGLSHFQSDYLFPSHRKKGAYYTGTPKHWNSMSKAAGIFDCRIHDLRHTFASIARELEFDRDMIGVFLGHSNKITTTSIYIHFRNNKIGNAVTKVSRVIKERLDRPIQKSFQWP